MSREFDNNKSIFLQIADHIIERVAKGELPEGEKIESVRELAAEMGVNPNTIMRTYSELQNMEIIENKRGIGYFVRTDAQATIIEKKKTEFFNTVVPNFIKQAQLLGIKAEELEIHLSKLNHKQA
jgi:DNA-binding transcriptional regulator YhcF (GntR family)